ncbi:hypothetical protein KP79_PYT11481 [Mizuhopecten yessoensis]|uniref:Uncharacterized protein n=1 Tax=Mizuhopecten yessoensis TaxID=6573 RepID=A0A210PDZ6_MIZYE|nr:hypothetical protein KP79_PYT11481 [Mizuhopecten yessoensis]
MIPGIIKKWTIVGAPGQTKGVKLQIYYTIRQSVQSAIKFLYRKRHHCYNRQSNTVCSRESAGLRLAYGLQSRSPLCDCEMSRSSW